MPQINPVRVEQLIEHCVSFLEHNDRFSRSALASLAWEVNHDWQDLPAKLVWELRGDIRRRLGEAVNELSHRDFEEHTDALTQIESLAKIGRVLAEVRINPVDLAHAA